MLTLQCCDCFGFVSQKLFGSGLRDIPRIASTLQPAASATRAHVRTGGVEGGGSTFVKIEHKTLSDLISMPYTHIYISRRTDSLKLWGNPL